MADTVLGIDIGGTKTAWGLFDLDGNLIKEGRQASPNDEDGLFHLLDDLLTSHQPKAIGIGIACTLSADHKDILVCTNIPSLSHSQLTSKLREAWNIPFAIDNDARCALIGEVWKGSASNTSSAVMITLGTGVGGAVMQKGKILPHPSDISLEISRLMVDPTDPMPAHSGHGTLEAFLGGRNLENRLGVSMADISKDIKSSNAESKKYAKEIWDLISYYFLIGMKAICMEYSPKLIIVGGRGGVDLNLFIGDNTIPCQIIPAELGEAAGVWGAGRIGIDALESYNSKKQDEETEWN